MYRVILHVDMDSFYSQIEERENRELTGNAVVVCMFSARGGDSGAVAAANYIARDVGIKSGMPISRAKKIAPDAVFLHARREFYREVSKDVMEILRSYAEAFEQVSIDEAYLDLTKKVDGDFQKGKEIALMIKKEVSEKEQLTCSVGIGPNKLIAKMAANARKPDGLSVILPEEVTGFLSPMLVKKLFRVGPKTAQSLEEMKITTIGELSKVDSSTLIKAFGNVRGTWLYEASKGIDESPVQERGEREQISRLKTLEKDTRDAEVISGKLGELAKNVMDDLSKTARQFRTVTVIFIMEDLKTRTKSRTLPHPSDDYGVLVKVGDGLLDEFLDENESKIRRVGIGVSELQKPLGQKTLFEF